MRSLDRERLKPHVITWLQSEEELELWRKKESRKRTALATWVSWIFGLTTALWLTCSWAIETQGSLLYDVRSMVTLRTRQLPIPPSEGLWEALTIKEWHAERLKQGASTEILVRVQFLRSI